MNVRCTHPLQPPLARPALLAPSGKCSPRVATTRAKLAALAAAAVLLIQNLNALTMEELLRDPKMTPKRFASLFEDFTFELHPFDVQNPKQFLASRCGDCIDYAVLADYVLKQKGYDTRLIRIEMVGKNMGHAVCYVTESRAYLDYNNRKYAFQLQRSGSTIREIAVKVADSLEANWTFAQEFTFDYKTYLKRTIFTVVKTDLPATDADRVNPRPPRAKSNS